MNLRLSTKRLVATGALAIALSTPFAPSVVGAFAADAKAPVSTTAGNVIAVDRSNLAQVKEMAKTTPVIFLVTAPSWCGACQDLEPKINRINAAAGGKWILAVLDEDKDGGAHNEFRVNALPTMIPWGKNGEMSSPKRFIGSSSEDAIKSWTESVVKAYGPVTPTPAPTTPAPSPTTPAPGDGTLPPLPAGAVQLTDANFDSAVIEESKKRTVVIDISKDQCLPCIELAPVMDEAYRAGAGAWQYTRLDGTAYPALWKRFDNPWFPTLIAIRDGKEISRRSGYEGDSAAVRAWLDEVAKGGTPASDPIVMKVSNEADWTSALELSKRHPVALRIHLDNYLPKVSAKHGKIAAAMAKGDGGKWTLANAEYSEPQVRALLQRHGIRLSGMPTMIVIYNGKTRLTPLNGSVDEATMRAWVDTMLSTHYPEN